MTNLEIQVLDPCSASRMMWFDKGDPMIAFAWFAYVYCYKGPK